MTSIARINEVYTEVLNDRMGLDTQVEGDRIAFQPFDGLTCVITTYANDPEYLHLWTMLPGLDSALAQDTVNAICIATTHKTKGVKNFVDSDGDLLFSVEMLVAAPDCLPTVEHLQGVLPRSLSMLLSGIRRTLTDLQFAQITTAEAHESNDT
jgi:hypothetical protein